MDHKMRNFNNISDLSGPQQSAFFARAGRFAPGQWRRRQRDELLSWQNSNLHQTL